MQRIPLVYLIGQGGMATFGIAFNIYTLLLTIATAGIPSALSKLVSERTELGRHAEADRIFRASVQFALGAGVVMTVFLLLYAPTYANASGDASATLAIRALAPALLLFPLIAIVRGYFQGRRMMMPNGLSQIIEQILRLVTSIGLAALFLAVGWGHDWAVAGASFGGVMGSVGAVAVLAWYWRSLRRQDRRERGETAPASRGGIPVRIRQTQTAAASAPQADNPLAPKVLGTYGSIFKAMFTISIPIVLFSLAVPLIYFIDSSMAIPLLRGTIGETEAKVALGILTGQAQSLAGIPIILAIALSQSIVPIVSSAYARGDLVEVKRQAAKALQISVLTGLPVVLAIVTAARPINGFLFPNEAGYGIVALLTASALFQIVMQTSGSILMGIGEMRPLIVNVCLGIVAKLVVSLLLAPVLGMYGIVLGTAGCFVVMMAFNARVIRKKVPFRVMSGRRWGGLAGASAILLAVGFAVERLCYSLLSGLPAKLLYLVDGAITGIVVLSLYPVLMMALKVVTKDDVAGFPAPLKKLIARVGRLVKR
ncbi:hypothetical protein J31TS4_40220 [Paenibacillus sp. J31TS4]|nr:hypothetical protein J31TS4_40220 [Paenibacillus sp. J31TS4]